MSYKKLPWSPKQKVIARKFWQGKSLADIGKLYGLSRQRIFQIIEKLGIHKSNNECKRQNLKELWGEQEYYNIYGIPKSLRNKVWERD